MAKKSATEAGDLWEKFFEQFYNPYALDVEFEYPDLDKNPHKYPLRFCFYDYDFCYYLEYRVDVCLEHGNQGAWSIYCTKSFYVDLNEPEVEIDTI